MVKLTPPDPRNVLPSRADPHHRAIRKDLEKKHGYGYTEPLVLAMLGVGLIWNIENQVSKREERKEEENKKEEEREERWRRRRENRIRSGTWDPRREHDSHDRRSELSDRSDRSGGHRDSSRHNHRDNGRTARRYRSDDEREHRDDPRRLDCRVEEYPRRDDYKDQWNDYRYEERMDGSVRRGSRRDSF
ncbi:uncharacterized protein BCR38DRAFT_485979 [Pseudomassariella vexata]|uniref:Uncharacterized protein n=1 Tax=Pseudomassariella vexata TaxID=1141098 RepID=A0A1Y2DVD9_9PEZI|nr:uncharacterized protein BCR38DRAFT_485979 [Pseudomassariella vexata]ORY63217.1 hypothetical protein BCR38DRAFT_485979 [Pseudomassariella vexata]